MSTASSSFTVRDRVVHMTGIKGTGMAALAEILHANGARVSGSDVAERFFTDELLERIGIAPAVGFSADHLPDSLDLLVYSAAYDTDNPERRAAAERGVEQRSYTEVLGALSRDRIAVAVSGVHGKTTTTAILGMMVREDGTPATVIVGSGVSGFGGAATYIGGNRYLIAETCEYRRHFLDYDPDVLLVTSVEADHLDYFKDREDVVAAFIEFGMKLPEGGTLVYCADDEGATEVADRLTATRPDIETVPYGFSVTGAGGISDHSVTDGRHHFSVGVPGFPDDRIEVELAVPGNHSVLNTAAAIMVLAAVEGGRGAETYAAWRRGIAGFAGTKRRSEVVAEIDDVLILDDYAHHPTAIRTTLEGYRAFWPDRRIIVDFMSHTYSRSEALLEEFVTAFAAADLVVLNDIYASAREHYSGGLTGRDFADAVARHHHDVRFIPEFEAAATAIAAELTAGDLFVTMGAGDNFRIGTRVAELRGGNR